MLLLMGYRNRMSGSDIAYPQTALVGIDKKASLG